MLRKYDRAFHAGRPLATSFEHPDIRIHQPPKPMFGLLKASRTPDWAGHKGWTAAVIRHAEPQRSVFRNSVAFTPADIRALLAELYVDCDVEEAGGDVDAVGRDARLHHEPEHSLFSLCSQRAGMNRIRARWEHRENKLCSGTSEK